MSDYYNPRIQVFSREGGYLFHWPAQGSPAGLAFDERDVLYVMDEENCRVRKFSLNGDFLGEWGQCGFGPGELSQAAYLTAGEGAVYVVAHGYVEKFTVDGQFIREFRPGYHDVGDGIAFGQDRTIWLPMSNADPPSVFQLTTDGDFIQRWSAIPPGAEWAEPFAVDQDSAGDMYVANSVWGTVEKFTSGGVHLESIWVNNVVTALDVYEDRELYVIGDFENTIYKFVRQPTSVEPTTWGQVKAHYR